MTDKPESSSHTHKESEKEAGKHVSHDPKAVADKIAQRPGKPTKAVMDDIERTKESQKIVADQRALAAKDPGAPLPVVTDIELEVKDVSESNVRQKLVEAFVKKYPKAIVEQSSIIDAVVAALPTEWKKYKRDDKGGPINLTLKSPSDEPPYYELKFTGMTLIKEEELVK